MMKTRALMLSLTLGLMMSVVGCGSPAQPAGSLKVTMTEYAYSPSNITLPEGKMVFYLVNSGSNAHTMVIRDGTGIRLASSDLISAGDASVFNVKALPVGSYTIFCDQQGHEASGMVGTLTVTAAASESPNASAPTTSATPGTTASPKPTASSTASPYAKASP